jgi:hypothetical protein
MNMIPATAAHVSNNNCASCDDVASLAAMTPTNAHTMLETYNYFKAKNIDVIGVKVNQSELKLGMLAQYVDEKNNINYLIPYGVEEIPNGNQMVRIDNSKYTGYALVFVQEDKSLKNDYSSSAISEEEMGQVKFAPVVAALLWCLANPLCEIALETVLVEAGTSLIWCVSHTNSCANKFTSAICWLSKRC